MNKTLLVTAALVVMPLYAFAQAGQRSEDRDDPRDAALERMLRELGGGGDMHGGGGLRRGAAFLLRSGESTVAVRCDPRESMRTCLDITLTLLDKARAAAPSGTPTPPR
jgi:hypothetical protein